MTAMPPIATITIELRGGIPRGSDLDEEWLQLVAAGLHAAAVADVFGEDGLIGHASVTCTLSTDVGAEPTPEEVVEVSRLLADALADATAKDERLLAAMAKHGHGHHKQKHAAALARGAWHVVSWLRAQGVS